MKTLKTLTAALLIILGSSAFAAAEKNDERLLADYTIKKFVNAVSSGEVKGISGIFDNEVTMTTAFKKQVMTYNKKQIVGSLKFLENIKQNCETEYQMIERTPSQALAKVVMKYDGFSKISYISLSNTTDGWKITHIATSVN